MTYLKKTLSQAGNYTIELNRPDKHHALNTAMLKELTQTFTDAFADEAVNVIIIRAAGKVFCAGADLVEMQQDPEALIEQIIGLLSVLRHKNKPIIVALNGHVYGGGSLLLGYADVIMATSSVSVIMPEIKSAIWPVFLMPVLKPHLPQATLMYMAMTAEPLSAERAYALGWFSEVVKDDDQLNLSLKSMIDHYCQHSQATLKLCYRCYQNDFNQDLSDDLLAQLGEQLLALIRIRDLTTI